jgi:hypothetical protein
MSNGSQPPPVPSNYGPGLSMYNLMEATGIVGPDGTPQIAVKGVTQDIGAAFGWMTQGVNRSVALVFVLACGPTSLQASQIPPKN